MPEPKSKVHVCAPQRLAGGDNIEHRQFADARWMIEGHPVRTAVTAIMTCDVIGDKLGPLLVQLPPSLRFDAEVVEAFFTTLCDSVTGGVVCEPRHASWFMDKAEHILPGAQVGRVAADPALVPQAAQPGGWPGLVYERLYGSPEMYVSAYSDAELEALTQRLHAAAQAAPMWCIFNARTDGVLLK